MVQRKGGQLVRKLKHSLEVMDTVVGVLAMMVEGSKSSAKKGYSA